MPAAREATIGAVLSLLTDSSPPPYSAVEEFRTYSRGLERKNGPLFSVLPLSSTCVFKCRGGPVFIAGVLA